MLLTLGNASHGDYGEQSLVSRFLYALILNEYSIINVPSGQAFQLFSKRCLDVDPVELDLKQVTATVEFQASRCGTGGDATKFDALLTIGADWVWGIEAKYFDFFKVEQIEREVRTIRLLAERLCYRRAGLLLVAPEEQLGSLVRQSGGVCESLRRLLGQPEPAVRIASWETIFEIIAESGSSELTREIVEYCRLRNRNECYPAKLQPIPQVRDSACWESMIREQGTVAPHIPQLSQDEHPFSRFGGASAELAEIFHGDQLALAGIIVQRAKHFGFELKPQKSGYANLSRSGRAHAQIHPHLGGVALAVREADQDLPSTVLLARVNIKDLNGRRGRNKSWLDGDGRFTHRPAAAVLVPIVVADSASEIMQEVDRIFLFATSK